MSGEVEAIAREMLAAEFDAAGKARSAVDIRRGPKPGHCTPLHMNEALRAIAKALSRTPSDADRTAVVEECVAVCREMEADENGRAWDKRHAGRDDNFNCARASAASILAERIRRLSTPAGEDRP